MTEWRNDDNLVVNPPHKSPKNQLNRHRRRQVLIDSTINDLDKQTTMTKSLSLRVLLHSVTIIVAIAWSSPQEPLSRRDWFQQTAVATAFVSTLSPQISFAASTTDVLLEELQSSQSKLQDIPTFLKNEEWEKVRTILKTPPVNKLWNLGDSQNTVLKLAKETGNVEFFELKDEIAYNLQMCDQLTYDNVFVYFQPGNGKIKIKEPTDSILKAISQIQEVVDESK